MTIKRGIQEEIGIVIDPAGARIVGVDLVLKYDPTYIKIIDIKDEDVFSFQPKKLIDNISGIAKVAFTNNYDEFLVRKRIFAQVVIEGLRENGETSLNFDFTRGKTTDTNIVSEFGNDVLESVDVLKVVVVSSNDSKNNSSNPSSSQSTEATQNNIQDPKKDEQIEGGIEIKNVSESQVLGRQSDIQDDQEEENNILRAADSDTKKYDVKKILFPGFLFLSGLVVGIILYKFVLTRPKKNVE